jgi:P4 family phage/plasmid primase-like protien
MFYNDGSDCSDESQQNELFYSPDPFGAEEPAEQEAQFVVPQVVIESVSDETANVPSNLKDADDQRFDQMLDERPAALVVLPVVSPDEGEGILSGGERLTKEERRAAGNMEIGMDTWCAQLMVKRFGDLFVYCPELKGFLVWDGRRWRRQVQNLRLMRNLAWRTGNSIWPEVAAYTGKDQERMIGAARTLHSLKGMNSVIGTLSAITGVSVSIDRFDAKPDLLNAWNGTIELKTGDLRAHRQDDYLTGLVPCNYIKGLVDKVWLKYLNVSFESNMTEVQFMLRLTGLIISGDLRFEKWIYLKGEGENGKSVFGEAMMKMLGTELTAIPRPAMIEETRWAVTCNPDMAELPGVLLAFIDELKKDFPIDGQVAKSIASSSTLTANPKNVPKFDFRNAATLMVASNWDPKVSDTSHGMWRKMLVVPFDHEVTEEEKDFNLKATLAEQEHREGILSMAVDGYIDLINNGYDGKDMIVPERFEQAHFAYKRNEHPLAAWVEDRATLEPGAETLAADLEADIRDWKTQEHKAGRYHNDIKTGSSVLSRHFTSLELGKEERGANRTVWRLGIALKYPRVDTHIEPSTPASHMTERTLADEMLAEIASLDEQPSPEQPTQDEAPSSPSYDGDEWLIAA